MSDNSPDNYTNTQVQLASLADVAQDGWDFIVAGGQDYGAGMTATAASYAAACQVGLGGIAIALSGGTAQMMPAAAGAYASGTLIGAGFASFCNAIANALAQFPSINDIGPVGVAPFSEYGAMLNNGSTASYGSLDVGVDSNGNIMF